MRVRLLVVLAVVAALAQSPVHAYLKLGAVVNGTVVDVTWREPVRYFVSNRAGGGVSAGELARAVERAAATWARVDSAQARFAFQGMTTAVPEIVEDVVQAIYEKFDHRFGGFGEGAKFPHPEAIDFALVMVAKSDDHRMREVVRITLDRMMNSPLRDRVDGGMFRFSSTADWRTPHHEKVLDANALQMRNYLEAFQLFGDTEYRLVAEEIVRWLTGPMLDGDTGAFFGSQEDDVEYYSLESPTIGFHAAPGVSLIAPLGAFQVGLGFDYFAQVNDTIPSGFVGLAFAGVKL